MADLLEKQVARVARRLFVGRVLAVWPWCATATLAIAALFAAANIYWSLGVAPATTVAAAVGVSLATAFSWAALRREGPVAAAIELDRRCKLAERVSTATAFRVDTTASPEERAAAELVRADAERAASRVDVRAAFPLRPTRRFAWPLVPTAALAAIFAWLAPPTLPPAAEAGLQATTQVRESAETLVKKLEEKKKAAENLKLTEARKLLEKLQEETRKLADERKPDPKQALVRLNDLSKELEARRRDVAGADQMKQQLSRLRSKETGPAEKLARDLQKGDFGAALDELQKLREQLKSNGLSDDQRRKLTKQLDELEKQLQRMAEEQQRQNRQMAEQLAEKQATEKQTGEKSGKADPKGEKNEADDLGGLDLGELSKQLAAREAEGKKLDDLRKAMQQALDGMQQGDGKEASKALQQLQDQFDSLAQQQAESKLLDGGMKDLEECKSGMCRNEENGPGQNGAGRNGKPGAGGMARNDAQQGGNQAGRGEANNENPTDVDDRNAIDSRVRPDVRSGPLRIIGPTDGPNAKGQALQVIQEQAAAVAAGTDSQPIERQSLDRSRRDQKRQYFDALRKTE